LALLAELLEDTETLEDEVDNPHKSGLDIDRTSPVDPEFVNTDDEELMDEEVTCSKAD
jgi:hypothetical protein